MIRSKEPRKRSFPKKTSISKKRAVTEEEFAQKLHEDDTTRQNRKDILEFVPGYNRGIYKQVTDQQQICDGADTKLARIQFPCNDQAGDGEEYFVAEAVWDSRGKESTARTKNSLIKSSNKTTDVLEVHHALSADVSKTSALKGYERVNEHPADMSRRRVHWYTGSIAVRDGKQNVQVVSENWKATNETRKDLVGKNSMKPRKEHAGGFDESESGIEAIRCKPEQNKNNIEEENELTSETTQKCDETQSTKMILKAVERDSLCRIGDNEWSTGDSSSLSNDAIAHRNSDYDDGIEFCVVHPTRCAPEQNKNTIQQENELTSKTTQKCVEKQSTPERVQRTESVKTKKILKVTECDFCQIRGNEWSAEDSSSLSNDATARHNSDYNDDTEVRVVHPTIAIHRSDYCKDVDLPVFSYDNSTSGGGDLSSNTELSTQSEEEVDNDTNEGPSISISSPHSCALEHEIKYQNSDFKSTWRGELLPLPSIHSAARKESKTSYCEHKSHFPRHASQPDVSNLIFSRDSQLGCSVDVYYEVLSIPTAFGVERGSEDIADWRCQSSEDVVPELPSIFAGPSDRPHRPSLFVPNLFWWRRPSDITELRSAAKHPCEGDGDTGSENITTGSTHRRYSDNVFGKPKKFLTLRFNQLREMWNKRDKTHFHGARQKARFNRKVSEDSISAIELHEREEAFKSLDIQQIQEKNELIINTLREVVRKCTFMDPMQRPRSNEVYKKLKKLLLV